jgi:5'-nucleotidase
VDEAFPHFDPRPDVAEYVARYVGAARDYAQRKVGMLGSGAQKSQGELQNTGGPLGNLITDAQLAATARAGAQIAFTNPFGIRRSLEPAADGSVTFGDIYAVQPFNNELMTLSFTGAQIKAILEQGFDEDGPEQILSPSAGFTYAYDRSRPVGDRIVSMTLDGKSINPHETYRVTVNNFLANGGDTFSGFTHGRDRVVGMSDIAALEAWLKSEPPRSPPTERRTTDLRPDLNPVRSTTPPGTNYR